ncbi:hypothetical protein [Zooshikella sp. RANM57]|uniref:hypothetical protein n=1 Tax=Zooshikella sp. RANM57 TaxID=3425863 RepID=UPI003D6DB696
MPAEEIRDWLKKQPAEFREDMRQRLNTEREKRSNRGDINPNHPVKTHQQRTLENDDYVGVNQ